MISGLHPSRRRPWIFVGVGLLAVATTFAGTPFLHVGTVALLPADLLAMVALASALTRASSVRANLGANRDVLIVFALALGFSLVRGFKNYGQPAGQEFRSYFWLVALALFVVSRLATPETAKRVLRWWLLLAVALSGLAVYSWLTKGISTSNEGVFVNGQFETARALVAAQALIVAQGALIAFNRWDQHRQRPGQFLLFACLTVVAILLQHRTVWAVLAFGVFTMFATSARLRRLLWPALYVGAWIFLLTFWGPVAGLVTKLSDSASTVSTSSGTLADRLQSWSFLVQQNINEGPLSIMVGRPFGSGYARVVGGRFEDYGPHNFYVQTFLRAGLLGGIAFVILLCAAWRRSRRFAENAAAPRHLRLGLLVTILVFMVAYPLDWSQGLLLGFLLLPPIPADSPAEAVSDETPNEVANRARGETGDLTHAVVIQAAGSVST